MDIVITGSSGLIGTALKTQLTNLGHRPIALVRRAPEPGADEIRWQPSKGEIDAQSLEGVHAVVNLAGANIGGKRWSDAYRKVLVDSRVDSTQLLSQKLSELKKPPRCLLSGSAIGFYGERGNAKLDETSSKGNGFLSDLTQSWEQATQASQDAGIRTVYLRTGIVLSPKDGALKKLLPLFKLFIGGKFGDGKQYMSWISIDDEIKAITHLLDSKLSGPVNLTAPNPATNSELTSALAKKLKRPSLVPVPKFGPQLLLGKEMANNLLFDSVYVQPAKLIQDGYSFKAPTITEAFDQIL